MSSTALSATRFAIAALAFTPYVIRGLKLPHVRKNAAELALWLFGAPLPPHTPRPHVHTHPSTPTSQLSSFRGFGCSVMVNLCLPMSEVLLLLLLGCQVLPLLLSL